MFSLTRKVDYALIALSELADQAPKRVSARDIATRHEIPFPILTNVLNQLVRSGLIASSRGMKGGYTLVRSAEIINMVDVIEAIEGAFRLTACCVPPSENPESYCNHFDRCRIVEPIHRLHELIRDMLCQVTMADLAKNRLPIGLESLPAMLQRCDH
ncbi:MAG: Rrf2 family transcriptional regulator [Planctomycetes bacterium]|nr:Rrf2 family transcriptional regulator [Planctomycetota bacterium]